MRGAAHDVLGTNRGSYDGGRKEGVAMHGEDGVVEEKGLVCGPRVAPSPSVLCDKANLEPVPHPVGKVQREKKGPTLDVKGTMHDVKGGDPKLKTLIMDGEVGVQRVSSQRVTDVSSRGSINSSPQATRDHPEVEHGCLNYLPKERGELSEVKGMGQAHKEVASQLKRVLFAMGVEGVRRACMEEVVCLRSH